MGNQELLGFVSAYPSNQSKVRIVVSDRNADFRQRVAAYVVENPKSASTELIRDLIEQESAWGAQAITRARLSVSFFHIS